MISAGLLARIVASTPGGGIHRAALAERVGLARTDPAFTRLVMTAYALRKVDFVRGYVVTPAPRTVGSSAQVVTVE